MIIAAIDPGMDGGICKMDDQGAVLSLIPMPTIDIKKGKKSSRDLNLPIIRDIMFSTDHIVIEKSQPMTPRDQYGRPKAQGHAGAFNYGKGYGCLIGLCVGQNLPYTEVTPQSWRKVMCAGMDKGKGSSIKRCMQLYPGLNLFRTPRCVKPHDGMAEAVLIARYWIDERKL